MVKFFTSMEMLHLAVLFAVLIKANGNQVDVTSKESVSVRPNEEADLLCTTNTEILACMFESPQGNQYTVIKGLFNDGGRINYLGEDNKRDCGIKISNVKDSDHGEWSCIITANIGGEATQGSRTISVSVLKAPSNVNLNVDKIMTVVDTAKDVKIRCSATGGYPEPSFSWTLSGKPVDVQVLPKPDDADGFFQDIIYTPRKEDNEKDLQCTVNSEAYTQDELANKLNMASTKLDIQYKPIPVTKDETFYGLTVGKSFQIRIPFRLNPAATELNWEMHDLTVPAGSESQHGKYTAEQLSPGPVEGDGQVTAVLTINEVTQDDVDSTNKLRVKNDQGETEIHFMLALGEKPQTGDGSVPDGIPGENSPKNEAGTGPVIAIVIVILVIIVAAAFVVVARAQGLLCFAAPLKSEDEDKEKAVEKEEGSDTESADQTEPAKTETDGEPAQAKKSLPARMTSLLTAMKKTVGGPKKSSPASPPTEAEELKQSEETGEDSEEDKKDDIVYADLDKSAMSEGNVALSVENEKTEYAEIKSN